MKIKPMLARLESAMGCQNLIEQMLLLPEPASPISDKTKTPKSINLVVGYSSSPRSQTALDLTLWIAHQTRQATQKQVTVQVVYVVDENQPQTKVGIFSLADEEGELNENNSLEFQDELVSISANCAGGQTKQQLLTTSRFKKAPDRHNYKTKFSASNPFEQADRILWQARCLAEEWRGSFKAHLRFGNLANELRKVVEEETADLLFLGCQSNTHAIVQQLGKSFPCAVLGIPKNMTAEGTLVSCCDSRSV